MCRTTECDKFMLVHNTYTLPQKVRVGGEGGRGRGEKKLIFQ